MDEYISFDWSGRKEGMLVGIELESTGHESSIVRVTER